MKMLCIESCLHCNHLSLSSHQCWNPLCGEDQPIVDDIKTIPEWCPLDDAPSESCQYEHPLKRIVCYGQTASRGNGVEGREFATM